MNNSKTIVEVARYDNCIDDDLGYFATQTKEAKMYSFVKIERFIGESGFKCGNVIFYEEVRVLNE